MIGLRDVGFYTPEGLVEAIDIRISKLSELIIKSAQAEEDSWIKRKVANFRVSNAEDSLRGVIALAGELSFDWLSEGKHYHESAMTELAARGVEPAHHSVFQPIEQGE